MYNTQYSFIMQSDFVVNKYLHTVASGWIFINLNYDVRNHELKKKSYMTHIQVRKLVYVFV